MEKCPNTKEIIIFGRNQVERCALIFNPPCKSWDCEYCAEYLKAGWVHQAARGAQILATEGNDLQFITLTSRGYTTPVSSLVYFRTNWPKLRKRASYLTNGWTFRSGTEWAYFLVPERHKSGVLHVHVVASTHLEGEYWWKENAFACGFGYIVDVEPMIDPLGAALYVAKYLHKDAGGQKWPKHFRRVRHSQNWPIAHEKPLEGWEWEAFSADMCWQEKHALIDMGWNVQDKRQ